MILDESPLALRDYALLGGHYHVDGWLDAGAISMTIILSEAQRRAGIEGPAAEIGVHHGRYFILLSLLAKGGLALDVFADTQLNIDQSGRGDRAAFRANLRHHVPEDHRVRIHQADSLTTSPEQLLALLEGRRPRLFSIDGGHTSRHATNDLELATAVCHEGAVVVVDDFENSQWPGVRTGVEDFFAKAPPGWVPFALGSNKLFLAQKHRAGLFAEALTKVAGAAGVVSLTTSLFGHPVQRCHFDDPWDLASNEIRREILADPQVFTGRFSRTDRPVARLISGWDSVGESGVWMTGATSRLALLLGAREGAWDAAFRVRARIPSNTADLRVRIGLGDGAETAWRFEDPLPCNRELTLPASPNRSGCWALIDFAIDEPPNSTETGSVRDGALFGVGLEAFRLAPASGGA